MQIRDIPDEVKHVLKVRAAAAGQSLSEYARAELTRSAERPTLAELNQRLRSRGGPTPPLKPSAAEILRAERDSR